MKYGKYVFLNWSNQRPLLGKLKVVERKENGGNKEERTRHSDLAVNHCDVFTSRVRGSQNSSVFSFRESFRSLESRKEIEIGFTFEV